jgi:hypothetical protein
MAMVHSYMNSYTETCEILDAAVCAAKHDIGPLSFRLNAANEFQVFELLEAHDSSDVPDRFWKELPRQFWEEIGNYIRSNQLHDIVGIAKASQTNCCWVETSHPSGHGTIARRNELDEETEWGDNSTVTEWAFFDHEGTIRYRATRKCDTPPEGGGHVRS